MNLARSEFKQLSEIYEQDNILDIIEKNNVRVIIAGDLEGKLKTAFPDVREGFLKVQERTKNNTQMTMYLCFAYDSIHEYNTAVELTQMPKGEAETKNEEESRNGDEEVDQVRQKQ